MSPASQNIGVVAWTVLTSGRLHKEMWTLRKHIIPRKEPMIPSTLPDYPWQRVGTDLFVLGKDTYLVTVEYFSHYPEIVKLTSKPLRALSRHWRGYSRDMVFKRRSWVTTAHSTSHRNSLSLHEPTHSTISLAVHIIHKVMGTGGTHRQDSEETSHRL